VSTNCQHICFCHGVVVHTPFTILVPTLVRCPFKLSLRGLLITNVLPGSIGASNA